MGLTWRDAVSALALGLVLIVYAAYLQGATLWLISSTGATTAVVLILGGGCAVCAAGDLYTRPQSRPFWIVSGFAAGIGLIALGAGLIGLIGSSAFALKILVMATIILWGTATMAHVSTIGSQQ